MASSQPPLLSPSAGWPSGHPAFSPRALGHSQFWPWPWLVGSQRQAQAKALRSRGPAAPPVAQKLLYSGVEAGQCWGRGPQAGRGAPDHLAKPLVPAGRDAGLHHSSAWRPCVLPGIPGPGAGGWGVVPRGR